jgi:hypothetical protein
MGLPTLSGDDIQCLPINSRELAENFADYKLEQNGAENTRTCGNLESIVAHFTLTNS